MNCGPKCAWECSGAGNSLSMCITSCSSLVVVVLVFVPFEDKKFFFEFHKQQTRAE